MVGWLNDKRKNGDMMFAVRSEFIRRDGKTDDYSGMSGPYMSLGGARKKYNSIVLSNQRYIDQDWFTKTYSGWRVKIEATLIDWQVVDEESLDFDD